MTTFLPCCRPDGFSDRSNCRRAARIAGMDLSGLAFYREGDKWFWRLGGCDDFQEDPAPAQIQPSEPEVEEAPAEAPVEALPPKRAVAKGEVARRRAAAMEAVERGELPEPPDFSANTHKPFRKKLAALVALAEAGDSDGLREFRIVPRSTSLKALERYRSLCLTALANRQPSLMAEVA